MSTRKPQVYIETSVVSMLTARMRDDVELTGYQKTTQIWWQTAGQRFELLASEYVIEEATRGDSDAAQRRLAALADLPALAISEEVQILGKRLVDELAIPRKAIEDAYHVAIAAVNGIDYLVTWNCTHIANLQMRRQIERVCRLVGYEPPIIGTPEELLALTPTGE